MRAPRAGIREREHELAQHRLRPADPRLLFSQRQHVGAPKLGRIWQVRKRYFQLILFCHVRIHDFIYEL